MISKRLLHLLVVSLLAPSIALSEDIVSGVPAAVVPAVTAVVAAVPEVVAAVPAVVPSVWSLVAQNGTETLGNLYTAACNVASYVPYALKQVTEETKLISQTLGKTPLFTTALLACAGYGVYKLWNLAKSQNVSTQLQERFVQIREQLRREQHQAPRDVRA